jgi:hypothetical protein
MAGSTLFGDDADQYRPPSPATTTASGIAVDADVTNSGGNGGQLRPMLAQIEESYDQLPADGGYTTHADIEAARSEVRADQ